MKRKVFDKRGEMLIEVLASVLIVSLSIALLFSCVMASYTVDRTAQKVDESYYVALDAAEKQKETTDYPKIGGNVTINETSPAISIDVYGGEGVYSYKRSGS